MVALKTLIFTILVPGTVLGLAPWFLFVVLSEEPHLTRRFGESYQAYLHTVPRWLPRSVYRIAQSGEARRS